MLQTHDVQTQLERFVTKQSSLADLERWCASNLERYQFCYNDEAPCPKITEIHLSELRALGADEDMVRVLLATAMESGRIRLRFWKTYEATPITIGFGRYEPSGTVRFSNSGQHTAVLIADTEREGERVSTIVESINADGSFTRRSEPTKESE